MAATTASPSAPGTSSRRRRGAGPRAARGTRGAGLAELASLDDAAFRALFSGSPIKRIGRDRFVRNVLIAIGNSGERHLLAAAAARLADSSALVRAMAVWAVRRLADPDAVAALRAVYGGDPDAAVREEWEHQA